MTHASTLGEVRMLCTALRAVIPGNEKVIADCLVLPLILEKAPSVDGYYLASLTVEFTGTEPFLKYSLPEPLPYTYPLLMYLCPESDMKPSEYLEHLPHPFKLKALLRYILIQEDLEEIKEEILSEDAFYKSLVDGDEEMIVRVVKAVVEKAGDAVGAIIDDKIGDWLVGVLDRVADK